MDLDALHAREDGGHVDFILDKAVGGLGRSFVDFRALVAIIAVGNALALAQDSWRRSGRYVGGERVKR